ncbi:hypothetical protein [Streptomyces sp. NPDC048192]|uniref:hypothetical protein n=1 Tax=Streptomyces sp. NPDC048192 TaxID=3365510 RepID=UPI003716EF8C
MPESPACFRQLEWRQARDGGALEKLTDHRTSPTRPKKHGVDNARLHQSARFNAEQLQRALLPELPHVEHLELAARRPAGEGQQQVIAVGFLGHASAASGRRSPTTDRQDEDPFGKDDILLMGSDTSDDIALLSPAGGSTERREGDASSRRVKCPRDP